MKGPENVLNVFKWKLYSFTKTSVFVQKGDLWDL